MRSHMVFGLPALLLLTVVVTRHVVSDQSPDTDLKLVHLIFRHGPRTPADTYPNDPYVNFSFAPAGWGQLTNHGKLTQYQQGQFLRDRYNSFFGDLYSPDLLYAESTDVDRTKMSAQLELAGMWPPAEAQKWNPNLNWQPIPVHSTPLSHDKLLLVRVPCPKYHMEVTKVLESEPVQKELEALGAKQLYEELTNITGLTISSPDDVQSLYSTLKAEDDFNLTLPEWTQRYYPDRLVPITARSFIYNVYTNELQKLKGGPLLKKIVSDSQEKVNGTLKPTGRKLYMYAGHDSTISNLLMALKVWDTQIPNYGILIMIELHQHKKTGEHGIKVYLRNTTTHEPYPLTLPGCDHLCPFNQFVTLTRDVIPGDLTQECEVDDPNYVPPSAAPP